MRLCAWCQGPIPASRKGDHCGSACHYDACYDDAQQEAIAEAQAHGPKVIGLYIGHAAAPKGSRLLAIEGETAVLGCPDGRMLRRPLAEVYDLRTMRARARALYLERGGRRPRLARGRRSTVLASDPGLTATPCSVPPSGPRLVATPCPGRIG